MRHQEKKSTHQPKGKSQKRKAELRAAGPYYNCEKSGHVDATARIGSRDRKGRALKSLVTMRNLKDTVETMFLGAIRFGHSVNLTGWDISRCAFTCCEKPIALSWAVNRDLNSRGAENTLAITCFALKKVLNSCSIASRRRTI
jgi:hypothetical protein